MARHGLGNLGQLLWAATIALALCSFGCTSAPGPLKKLSVPFGNSKDQSLRKQVEADSFPTAKQAGLADSR
jgi:hypothetical protein